MKNEVRNLDSNILNLYEIYLTKLLLYGDIKYVNKVNKKTLAPIKYMKQKQPSREYEYK